MKGFERVGPILDLAGVADLLGTSIDEIRRLAGEEWIPSTVVGGRRLFRRDDVLAWLRTQRVEPPEEPEGEGVP